MDRFDSVIFTAPAVYLMVSNIPVFLIYKTERYANEKYIYSGSTGSVGTQALEVIDCLDDVRLPGFLTPIYTFS